MSVASILVPITGTLVIFFLGYKCILHLNHSNPICICISFDADVDGKNSPFIGYVHRYLNLFQH